MNSAEGTGEPPIAPKKVYTVEMSLFLQNGNRSQASTFTSREHLEDQLDVST